MDFPLRRGGLMLVRNLLQKSVLGVVALSLGLGGALLAGEKKHSAAKEKT